MIALVVALGMNLFAYWNSDQMVLRMSNAQRGRPDRRRPSSTASCSELPQRAGLPMPRVYIIDEDQPNAFATGRNPEHAAVAVNTGLLRHLSREEITGVLAHELGHVQQPRHPHHDHRRDPVGRDRHAGDLRRPDGRRPRRERPAVDEPDRRHRGR